MKMLATSGKLASARDEIEGHEDAIAVDAIAPPVADAPSFDLKAKSFRRGHEPHRCRGELSIQRAQALSLSLTRSVYRQG
jgi:hypothetical protein